MTNFNQLLREYYDKIKKSMVDSIFDEIKDDVEILKYKSKLLEGMKDQPFLKGKISVDQINQNQDLILQKLKKRIDTFPIQKNNPYDDLKELQNKTDNFYKREYSSFYMRIFQSFQTWLDAQENLFSILGLNMDLINEMKEKKKKMEEICEMSSVHCELNDLKLKENLKILCELKKKQNEILTKFSGITHNFHEPEKIERIWLEGGCNLVDLSIDDLKSLQDSEIGPVMRIKLNENKI